MLVRITFIPVDTMWSPMYMKDVLCFARDCYVEQVLDDAHIEPLGVPKECSEAREQIE